MTLITIDEIDLLRNIRDNGYNPREMDLTGELDTLIRDLEELQDFLDDLREEEHESMATRRQEWAGIP